MMYNNICNEILQEYVKGKTYKELYKQYNSHIVQKCLNMNKLTLDYLSRIDELSNAELEILVFLIQRNRKISIHKRLLLDTLKMIRTLGLKNSIKFIGFMLSSKKMSKNIKRYDEIKDILDILKRKEYEKYDLIKLGISKPIIKTMTAILLYYIVESKSDTALSYFIEGMILKKRKANYLNNIEQHLNKAKYIKYKNEFLFLLKNRLDKIEKI